MAIRAKSISDWKNDICQSRRLSRTGKLRRFFASERIRYSAHIRAFPRSENAHLPLVFENPSQICRAVAYFGRGTVLDAPCGYGRNAVALRREAARLEFDRQGRLAPGAGPDRVCSGAPHSGVRIGKIFTLCADLKAERWPFAPSSFSAIVCIHFAMIDLVPCLLSSLQGGGTFS